MMAIYHLHAKIINRGSREGGRSVVAAAAYRAAVRLQDERYSVIHDYTGKGLGVRFSAILTPENAPAWMRDRQALWNAVEAAEKRRDAQLARDFDLALPVELSHSQNVRLVTRWAQEQLVSRGMVADFSIHEPLPKDGQRNPHVHILATLRSLAQCENQQERAHLCIHSGECSEGGFGKKNREWNDTALLLQLRESWAKHVNDALAENGERARVNHQSFAAQGIDQAATRHVGIAPSAIERKGAATERAEQNRAIGFDNRIRPFIRVIERSKRIFAFLPPLVSSDWNGKLAELNMRESSPSKPALRLVKSAGSSGWRSRIQRDERELSR